MVIATGETHALADFVTEAFDAVGLDWHDHVTSDPTLMRPTDLRISRANPALAVKKLGWQAAMHMHGVVRAMVAAEQARMLKAATP